MIQAAMDAVAKIWTISSVEWASSEKPSRYCGFEMQTDQRDGLRLSQTMFEQELLSRWNITETLVYPAFKVTEEDDVIDPAEIKSDEVKSAQAVNTHQA